MAIDFFLRMINYFRVLKSVDDIITALGGPTKTAGLVSTTPAAVIHWRTAGFIPPGKFMKITNALNARGMVASPTVFGFDAPKRKRTKSN